MKKNRTLAIVWAVLAVSEWGLALSLYSFGTVPFIVRFIVGGACAAMAVYR